MTPLRFGMLTTFYPPYNFGGDGVDVQRTARALAARGHQVTVVHDVDAYRASGGDDVDASPESGDGVDVVALRSALGIVSPLLTHQFGRPVVHGRTIARLIAERAFDVVMFHNVSLVGGPGVLALGGSALTVYVAHEHWLVCPSHVLFKFDREPCESRDCLRCVLSYRRPPQVWRYTGSLERRLNDVDLFIARSEFSRRKHREFGFTRSMEVLPYFVPGEISTDRPHLTSASPHARPYFLFAGRLTRLKGVDELIRAFEAYTDADLLIAGDGNESTALREQAAGLPNVSFLGRLGAEELQRYYAHALAVVAPSRGYETFGLALIEAFRHGAPVIARRLGPFPEIVEQSGGGILFSNDSELKAALARVQNDPAERDRMAASAYRAWTERWSEGVVIDRLLDMIRVRLDLPRHPSASLESSAVTSA